jgi:farnesyl-diphosphate farnesyltransferase
MNTAHLGGALLKGVSRSFYLSVRVLPSRLRAPIGLAYLLARASDTIADSADAPVAVRLAHLSAFREMLRGNVNADALANLRRDINPPDDREERLIESLGECLAWLALLGEFDRQSIADVLGKIIRGQMLDVERFQNPQRVTALQTAADLEEYTYLVAGCVGEFWTRMCLHHLPGCSRIPDERLALLGCNFGKGLQLVNILRDIRADRRAGRCYLPEDELRDADSSPENPSCRVFELWHSRAEALLDDAREYIASLRRARLRIACFLPWHLGVATLRLIRRRSPLDIEEKVKVSRAIVRAAMLRALLVAFSDAPLHFPSHASNRS